MITLWVIRHGLTIGNMSHIMQGYSEGELSDDGNSMSAKLGERLKDSTFDKVYSSDLNRCR